MVELGETVGIIAAQSIGEPGTQLTMRTFHTGGVFSSEVQQTILAPQDGIVDYNDNLGGKTILTKYNEKVFFTTEKKVLTIQKNKRRYKINLPKNSIIFVQPKKRVFCKQIVAQVTDWGTKKNTKKIKENKEIKTEISGLIKFQYAPFLVEEKTKKEEINKIWITNNNILTYQTIYSCLNKAKYAKAVLKAQKRLEKMKVKITKRNFEKLKTKDRFTSRNITYIIQKVIKEKKEILVKKNKAEQVIKLENPSKKVNNLITVDEILSKKVRNTFSSEVIQTRKNSIILKKAIPYLISKGSKLTVKNFSTIKRNNNISYSYSKKQKTKDIVQGLPKIEQLLEAKRTSNFDIIKNNPGQLLQKYFESKIKNNTNKVAVKKSIEKLQYHLINKVQEVYSSQGVKISDKHIEIIVKQMTSKVIITKPQNSNLLAGEIIELKKAEKLSDLFQVNYEPIIMGISKVALTNQSFIAEACFQETTRILTRSAIQGKIDWLHGLKENIILGNIIPGGTGYER